MRLNPFFNSLVTKLFISLFVVFTPLIIIQIINNHYATKVIKSQVSQSNENMLHLYMHQLDEELNGVEDYVYRLSQENDLVFFNADNKTTYNKYVEAKIRLYNSMSKQSHFYTRIDSIFIYASDHKELIYTQNFGDSYLDRKKNVDKIKKKLENEIVQFQEGKWQILQEENQSFLFYLLKNDDVYVGAWVDMEELILPFELIDFGDSGGTLIVTNDFKPITQEELLQKESINLIEKIDTHTVKGNNDRFIVISEHSSKADFNVIALIPEQTILENMPFLQRISGILTFVAVLFLLCFIFLMRKIFILPINKIVSAMKELRKGNFDIRIPRSKTSTEFEMMNGSFNDMISRIESLKIDVYEEKINLQMAELKHLQLQINPHFFLNTLNIIYNLATVKDFHLIQEMSRNLSNYFRFMFKSDSYFVTIKDEIKHTNNYLKIQQLRFPDSFSYHLNVPEELMEYSVPPLMIQSIVENSIKHAFNMDDPIEIKVSIWQDSENANFIHVLIEDTGEGFPKDILSKLVGGIPLISEEGEHIGIWNVKRRLKILYGEEAYIRFSNGEDTGAIIHIKLPKKDS